MKKLILILTMSFMTLLVATQNTFAYHRQNGIFIGSFHYEMVMSDTYQLWPEVRYYESLPNVYEKDGKYYYAGDLRYLISNRTDYYGTDYPIFTLNNNGPFATNPADYWSFIIGNVEYNIPLGSMVLVQSNNVRFVDNGNLVLEFTLSNLTDNTTMQFTKSYAYDPDYYIGYDDGYNAGYQNGKNYGEWLHKDDFNNGYDIGYNAGKDDGYNAGYIDGRDDGYNAGYDDGYNDGFNSENDFWPALWGAVTAPFALFETEIFPGVTFGMIAMIPIVFGLLGFILNIGGGKKQ